ncbi:MAG: C39 family peptidase [Clostridia bacterium]|nr:C39 family peptidase [Clostridia bacterium]
MSMKRAFSIVLILALCLTFNSSTVFAAEADCDLNTINITSVDSENFVYLSGFENALYYNATMFTQSQGGNNCGPTAAANVLSYYKGAKGLNLYSGNITQSLYDQICSDCGYSSSGAGSSYTSVANGIKSFANRAGYSCNVDKYLLNLFSDIKRDINRGYPIIMINNDHMYVILGYSEGGSNGNCIYVCTGWESNMFQWIKYDPTTPYSVTLGAVNIY